MITQDLNEYIAFLDKQARIVMGDAFMDREYYAGDQEIQDYRPEETDPFQYGQDFTVQPEVWEGDDSWFDDEGVFGPGDM